jgi:hypothetical protein
MKELGFAENVDYPTHPLRRSIRAFWYSILKRRKGPVLEYLTDKAVSDKVNLIRLPLRRSAVCQRQRQAVDATAG